MDQARPARKVAIVVFNQIEALDFAGPYEVFLTSSGGGQDFQIFTVAPHEGPVVALGGLSLNPAYTIYNCPTPDLIIVPGGPGARTEKNNSTLTEWIASTAATAELVLSVCTGALIIAKADLLEGLNITTHHRAIEELKAAAPASSVIVENKRYVDNGKIILSAGVSAGIDMSLYVVGRLLGAERALRTASLMEYDYNPE
ncbi:DJ-1/PfpI family protein [Paenibacillus radicis (ex Gao et al. 2016)]|uniref:AraC family transcriptional regulator n=1 Tax=Paenibacillus radicis (ex Gao et al. 2016) TaxID=1737354 RepID=A0A917GW29_9BACL|nr:DJ-1/PfpI family protein [Paenibacillus radicis (ex Gao et al. 2016)]GGG58891.1 AraC family transcriptional regulator [Paenibacillus radicis (ex Gao et al. 2016)]